ncbi:MAG: substrate-binding domain-containing protein [Desulfobacteraceae bacterium]|jgi:PAS domain S-box-containing protein|nr:substrate-binding domain-containing protein [Desulfobacteraceae bacterium]
MEEYVWISKAAHHPVFTDRAHPILRRLADHYNVKITVAGPDDTATEPYVKAVYDAIERKVAGMMVIGWGTDEIVPAIDAAVNSGIPVVCVDSDIPGSKRLAHIGTDWFRMGSKMADKLAALMNHKGQILMLGMVGLDNMKAGFRGFQDQISHYPHIGVIGPVDDLDAGSDRAESIISNYLQEHPDLNGIVGFDGNSGPGAARALKKLGMTDKVRLVCVDADTPQRKYLATGEIDAAFFQKRETFTYLAFQLIYDYNHGSRVTGYSPGAINISGNIDTGFLIVTKENLDYFDSESNLDQAIHHHELSQQLALISSMVESVEELALAADENGRIVYANAACERFCGYTKKEMVGLDLKELFDLTSLKKSQIHQCLKEETPRNFEATAVKKDGSLLPVHISISPLKSEGSPRGCTLIASNISERKKSQKALIDSHVRFLTVLDSIDADIYVSDLENYEVLLINRHMRESFGEDLVGKTCHQAFRSESIPCSHCTNDKLLDSDGNPTGVCVWEGKNPITGKWYINYDRAIKWVDGRFVRLQIATDISRIKDLEKESLRIQAQLQQAQKMEAIGTLAGGIAHDFNNILSAVIGYTEIALSDIPEGTSQHRNLQEVLKAGSRARDLVKQILTFSRQTGQELKPVQIHQIIRETLLMLRASLPATVKITQDIYSKSAVLADPTQIHQVIMNLCTNAAHAMRAKGGQLNIDLSDVMLGRDFIEQHPYLSPGAYIKLRIIDTGHGMEKAVLDRIFDPFFTTKERGEGTGMGLAVVLGIVKSHGGTITVESEVGKGSTFNVFLPVIMQEVDHQIINKAPIPTGTERILFIDDEKSLVDLGKQILERLGYKVTIRTSSVEALELFMEQPDRFDLVITDMTMPNMTGDELAGKLMDMRAEIPVILCTGYSERISKERAHALGIKEFILKPIVMRELAKTVRSVLDQCQSTGVNKLSNPH